jgi:WD40 repeat protein
VFLSQPAGLAVADDGSVYVADLRLGAVLVYDRRGNFLRSLGSTFALRVGGAFRPTDVAVSDGSVAIAGARGVVIVSTTGDLKQSLTQASPGSPFIRPNGVAFAPDGSLLVSDTNNARIVSLQPDGENLWVFDKNSSTGNALGLGLPRGIAVAEDGSVLVADAFRFSIVRLSTDGDFVASWGEQGSGVGSFEFPNDVDVRGDRLLVADKENHRVQVLRVTAGLSAPDATEPTGETGETE